MPARVAVAGAIVAIGLAAVFVVVTPRDRKESSAPSLRSFVGSVSERVPDRSVRADGRPGDENAAPDDPAASGLASRAPDEDLPSLRGRAFVPERLVLRFRPDASQAEKRRVRSAIGAEVLRSLPLPGAEVVALRPGADVAAAAQRLTARPEVAYAEPDFVYNASALLPNDPRFSSLWGLRSASNIDIDAPEAWSATTGAPSVRIAVVDSGMAYDHPDLAANVWVNPGEQPANGIDDDGNGYVDDVRGWDFVGRDNEPLDLHGHGTHVAGTIAAQGNNAIAVTGVAWDAALVPLRVLDADGSGTTSSIASAFSYAGRLGVDVVNASLGGSGLSQTLLDSIRLSPGTLFVVAAGNDSANNDSVPSYPCNYDAANILCVAATTQTDGLASFSNYGASNVDLGAPGSGILSTLPKKETRFRDAFETGFSEAWIPSGTVPGWGTSADADGNYLADSPSGAYLPGTNSAIGSNDRIDLSGARGCRVRYALRLDTERDRDLLHVEASEDGAVWSRLASASGSTQGGWTEVSSDLSSFDGRHPYLRFRLASDDNATVGRGADIDDVEVRCIGTAYTGEEVGSYSGTSMAAPHVAGAAAVLKSAVSGLDPISLKTVLMDGVVPTSALDGRTVTGGRLNLARSLALVAPLPLDDPLASSSPDPQPSLTQSEQVTPAPTPSPSGSDPSTPPPSPSVSLDPTPTPTLSPPPAAPERSVQLRMRKHLVATGVVESSERRCHARVKIAFERKGVLVGATRSDTAGVFRERLKDRVGRYTAIVPRNLDCPRVFTTSRHRHRDGATGLGEQEDVDPNEGTTVTATGDTCWTYARSEERLHELLGASRRDADVGLLRLDPELSRVARLHAAEMARADSLFHTPRATLRGRVTGWTELGENIGVGSTPASLHERFMASPSHRDNIVHGGFDHVGVGVVEQDGRSWVTVLFEGGDDPGTTLRMPRC